MITIFFKHEIRYRQEGATQWIPVDVDPPASTKTVIHNLQPGTSYEFQVIGKNVLGDGMFSNIVKERTKGILTQHIPTRHDYNIIELHTRDLRAGQSSRAETLIRKAQSRASVLFFH